MFQRALPDPLIHLRCTLVGPNQKQNGRSFGRAARKSSKFLPTSSYKACLAPSRGIPSATILVTFCENWLNLRPAFEESAARQFDDLRTQRLRLGTMDLKIAATALVNDAL